MKLFNKEIRNFREPLIVAEISCNHKGQLAELLKVISVASQSGADAVKIQCYTPDSLTLDNNYILKSGFWEGENLYDLYKRAQTPFEWLPEIFKYATDNKINLFSSVYDLEGLKALEAVNCPAYKIASFEANDPYFIKKVGLTGKPVIVSTGTLSIEEVKRIPSYMPIGYENNLCIMYCVSKYPTKLSDLNFRKIITYDYNLPGTPIGFSDHTVGTIAATLSVAFGASIIEKHFNGVYNDLSPDSSFSIGPEEFALMSKRCKEVWASVNTDIEVKEETEIKRSLYVVNPIKKGDIISDKDLKSYRPNLGICPSKLQDVICKKAKIDIAPGTPMLMEYVE